MLEILEAIFKQFPSPDGFVKTKRLNDIYGQPALNIQIGDRNLTILEDGEITGTGSDVGDARQWKIISVHDKE